MLSNQIIRSIDQAVGLLHRLLLVVAPSGTGKTTAILEVEQRTGFPYLNVNLELSRRLLALTERQRALNVARIMDDIVAQYGSTVILLDNIELLFDRSLQQDPLRLLEELARNRTVVAAWDGFIDDGHLVYATPDHPEYRRYPAAGLLIVSLKAKSGAAS